MRAQSEFFGQKNSKKGLALSTTMAICIVLALLVALLVSMASLNITTTQAAVNQREAYIQAKSAIAYAEAYYAGNGELIPGMGESSVTNILGEGLIVFKTENIADGATFYETKKGDEVQIGADSVAELKENCVDTYIEVTHSEIDGDSMLTLNAVCKYGDDDAYSLAKEYVIGGHSLLQDNAFTGSINYQSTNQTRYVRFHVRATSAFESSPYFYMWYNQISPEYIYNIRSKRFENNPVYNDYASSSIINKLTFNRDYGKVQNGDWQDEKRDAAGNLLYVGPSGDCAMTYEGNGWYVTQKTFNLDRHVHFVNGIVTRKEARRSTGRDDQQSWEFFGIPIPEEGQLGASEGVDIYFELNQDRLLDMQWSGSEDAFTKKFKECGNGTDAIGQINNFAKFCGEYYTVYTKTETAIVHYRQTGNTTDDASKGIGGYRYEGYGWWRDTQNKHIKESDFSGTLTTPDGALYRYGNGGVISQNDYGKERILEQFVCYDPTTNTSASFIDEDSANEWFIKHGDLNAANYIEVNTRASGQPVDKEVNTTISYKANIFKTAKDVPTCPTSDSEFAPTKNENEEQLDFIDLETDESDPEFKQLAHASNGDFFVLSTLNNFQKTDTAHTKWKNLIDKMSRESAYSEDFILEYDVTKGMEIQFEILQRPKQTFGFSWDREWSYISGYSFDNDGSYYTHTATTDKIRIHFNYRTEVVTVEEIGEGGVIDEPDDPDAMTYSVVGWMNDWGRSLDGVTSENFVYELTNDMEMYADVDGYMTYSDGEIRIKDGTEYYFKIAARPKEVESGDIDWSKVYGLNGEVSEVPGTLRDDGTLVSPEDGANLIYFPVPESGKKRTYIFAIVFNPETKQCEVYPTELTDLDSYYILGGFNGWGPETDPEGNEFCPPDYKLESASREKLVQSSTTNQTIVYSYTLPDLQEAGDYKVRVASSEALKDDGTIDYSQTWGRDPDGTTNVVISGGTTTNVENLLIGDAPIKCVSYELTKRSYVSFDFVYYKSDPSKSQLKVNITPYSRDEDIKRYKVGFHNAKLVNVNDSRKNSQFNTPWDNVYLTYYTEATGFNCFAARMALDTTDGENWWYEVPEDAEYAYFSNMRTSVYSEVNSEDFEYTDNITNSQYKSSSGIIYFPITPVKDDKNRTRWTVGDAKLYNEYINEIEVIEKTEKMAYYGSTQCNYYDTPLVNLLNMLVSGGNPKPSQRYAFACHPYNQSNRKDGYQPYTTPSGAKLNFNKNQYVSYQGEKYFYLPIRDNASSYLIVQCANGTASSSNGGSMWGYLFEDQLSLEINDGSWATGVNSPYYNHSGTNIAYDLRGKLYMEDRAGGVFTSDKYYRSEVYTGDGSGTNMTKVQSMFNYTPKDGAGNSTSDFGYTPNWYTFRIPVSSQVTIKGIKGVKSTSTDIVKNNNTPFNVIKESTNHNRPIYIYQPPGTNDAKCYTYNINTGVIDCVPVEYDGTDGKKHTTSDVSVYFDNSETNWNHVMIHAYNPIGGEEYKEISVDNTTNDNDYYVYTFRDGKYSYFQFYEGLDSDSASVRKSAAGLEHAEHKSSVIYLTGEELGRTSDRNNTNYAGYDTRTCKLLAKGEATEFTWYMHPRTAVMHAYLDMDSVVQLTTDTKYFCYRQASGTYGCSYDKNQMEGLMKKKKSYETAYKNGNDGTNVWSASKIESSNQGLLETATEFIRTVNEAKMYVSENVLNAPTNSTWYGDDPDCMVFLEGELLQSSVFEYAKRWKDGLTAVYKKYLVDPVVMRYGSRVEEYAYTDDGKRYTRFKRTLNSNNIYSNESLQTVTYMKTITNSLRLWLDNKQETIKTTAVRIIVDDTKKKRGSRILGGWGKDKIHLYVKVGGAWNEFPNCDICTTTQADFYAFAFELDTAAYGSAQFAIAQTKPDSTDSVPDPYNPAVKKKVTMIALHPKNQYRYTTSLDIDNPKCFEGDRTTETKQITTPEIIEGSASPTGAMNEIYGSSVGTKFIANFKYDTRVETSSGRKYTIYAGAYEIDEKYAGFYTDYGYANKAAALQAFNIDHADPSFDSRESKGYCGVNVYSEEAYNFFTNPKNYGMVSAKSFSAWSSNRINSNKNLDIMTNAITVKGDAKATAPGKQVSFRYKAAKDNETLSMNKSISLQGETVTIAVNYIDFAVAEDTDFTIDAKKVIFHTDTIIHKIDGTTARIDHGTYVFNEKAASKKGTKISLKSTTERESDWRSRFALVSDISSELEGGKFVAK